jgi:hypothetical protein
MAVARGRAAITASASNFGSQIMPAPAAIMVLIEMNRPWMW